MNRAFYENVYTLLVIMIFLNMRGEIKSWCDRLTKITRKIRYFYRLLLCHFMEYDNEFLWKREKKCATGEFFFTVYIEFMVYILGRNMWKCLAYFIHTCILFYFQFFLPIYLTMDQNILNSWKCSLIHSF